MTACSIHSIKHQRLEAGVFLALKQHIHLAISYTTLIEMINTAPERKSQTMKLNTAILTKEMELAKVRRYKQAVYEDWKDELISREDYRSMAEDYEEQAARLREVLSHLITERDIAESGVDTDNPFLSNFRKYENIDKLTREILVELVDHVRVHEGGYLVVSFKYSNELRRIVDYIEANAVDNDIQEEV